MNYALHTQFLDAVNHLERGHIKEIAEKVGLDRSYLKKRGYPITQGRIKPRVSDKNFVNAIIDKAQELKRQWS